MWWIKVLWYLPLIFKVGKQVLELVEEVSKMKETHAVLKEANMGNVEPLKELVNKLGS